MKSRILLSVTLGVMSIVGIGAVSADTTTHAQYTGSFPFTLYGAGGPSPSCPMLPSGLIINGNVNYFNVVNQRVDANGVTYLTVNSSELGSATDNNGATYEVNYHNHFSETMPPSGYPLTFFFNDHFNVVGNGQASQLRVHVVLRAVFLSPSDPGTFTFVNLHGDWADCDVI